MYQLITKKGHQGGMRKIHVTWKFFYTSGSQGHFFEKTKNYLLDKVKESVCTKFQVCIIFSLVRRFLPNRQTHFRLNIGISLTGCSAHGDFDWQKNFENTRKHCHNVININFVPELFKKFTDRPQFILRASDVLILKK